MRLRFDRKSLNKGRDSLAFYVKGFWHYYLPGFIGRWSHSRALARLRSTSLQTVAEDRVGYYLRLPDGAKLDEDNAVRISEFKYPFGQKKKYATYFFDLYDALRVFPGHLKFSRLFGDVNHEPSSPTFVKTRPITPGTTNGVLMPLNTVRHFRFVTDPLTFSEKKDMIVFRNVVFGQPHRLKFLQMWYGHPMVDAGQINTNWGDPDRYLKPYMTIDEQLGYKFVACIEGNDVATNLKWVMSSNSVAVMPRPKFESWFMEGTLKPGVHYIEVADDYSDLAEKLQYYIDHPAEAEEIIRSAHEYVSHFKDRDFERTVARMVADRYFKLTN